MHCSLGLWFDCCGTVHAVFFKSVCVCVRVRRNTQCICVIITRTVNMKGLERLSCNYYAGIKQTDGLHPQSKLHPRTRSPTSYFLPALLMHSINKERQISGVELSTASDLIKERKGLHRAQMIRLKTLTFYGEIN